MRHNPGYGIMTELVKRRSVPVDRVEISLWRRDLHIVVRGHVEGTAAAVMGIRQRDSLHGQLAKIEDGGDPVAALHILRL